MVKNIWKMSLYMLFFPSYDCNRVPMKFQSLEFLRGWQRDTTIEAIQSAEKRARWFKCRLTYRFRL